MPNPNSDSASRPPGRPPRRDSTRSLDHLLDGAQAAFADRGYHAVTIHEICERANVGIGTFYANFEHKWELLQKLVLERALPIARLLDADDFADRDRLVAKLRQAVDDPVRAGLWRAWHEAVVDETAAARSQVDWRYTSIRELGALITEARDAAPSRGPVLDASVVAWAIVTLTRDLTIPDPRVPPDLAPPPHLIHALPSRSRPGTN